MGAVVVVVGGVVADVVAVAYMFIEVGYSEMAWIQCPSCRNSLHALFLS